MTGLDKSAQAALEAEILAGGLPIELGTPQQARQMYLDGFAADQNPLEPVAEKRVFYVGDMRLCQWRGQDAPMQNAPALLYLHGGGWVIGSPETHEDICSILANRMGAVVIAPDYRLAPEHPFPAALDDSVAALKYMKDNAGDLGLNPSRIAVGGDSAGGNLAAVVALMARDGVVPQTTAQLLIYPVTNQAQDAESFHSFSDGFGLTAAAMTWFRDHYLSDPDSFEDWRAAPLRASSLKGVCPASIILAGHDVLYSEGKAYAERLESEARATVHCWPGQIHGFVSKSGIIPEAHLALQALIADWKAADPG